MEFVSLYQEFYQPIYRYIYCLSQSEVLAEDITQDTFMKAYECFIGEGRKLEKSWFYTVARNKYCSYLRKKRCYREVFMEDEALESQEEYTDSSLPEKYVLGKELSIQVQEVLAQMSERYRTVLILRDIQELSLDEIADIMVLKREYVRKLLYKARQRFFKIWGERNE